MTVKVHFDGKVFVPDEPVNLRSGATARVVVESETSESREAIFTAPRRIEPVIVGLDPELARSIGEDPEFDIENS